MLHEAGISTTPTLRNIAVDFRAATECENWARLSIHRHLPVRGGVSARGAVARTELAEELSLANGRDAAKPDDCRGESCVNCVFACIKSGAAGSNDFHLRAVCDSGILAVLLHRRRQLQLDDGARERRHRFLLLGHSVGILELDFRRDFSDRDGLHELRVRVGRIVGARHAPRAREAARTSR